MNQLNLFAPDVALVTPTYRPDPDKVRARLRRILDQAKAAQSPPWPPTQVKLYCTIFPQMTDWLPDEEAAAWRAEFDAEMIRFGVAA